MARASVRLLQYVVDDIRQALDWYRPQSIAAAEGFKVAFRAAKDKIAEAPERWPEYRAGTRRVLMLPYPYAVIYRIRGGVVEIIAVAHTARRPGHWRDRVKHP